MPVRLLVLLALAVAARADVAIGDADALADPQALVVLGCQNAPELAARVDAAAAVLARPGRGRRPLVVLSGGPAYRGLTEAHALAAALGRRERRWSIARAFRLETDSLDTLGNAAFSAAALSGRALARVLVVTSDFHAARALMLFRRTLPAGSRVAVLGARGAGRTAAFDRARAKSEAASAARASREILDRPEGAVTPGDVGELVRRLVAHHALYRGRTDLARREY